MKILNVKTISSAVFAFMGIIPMLKGQESKWGKDSIDCQTNISLYREDYKQGNYKRAYEPWKKVLQDCPMSTQYVFADGSNILDYMIKNETDSVKKEAYIQEMFDFFDLRIKCYPDKQAYVLGRIGIYMMKYRQHEYKKAYEILGQAIDLGGLETSPQVLDVYFITAEYYMKKERLDTSILIDAYDKITENLDAMLDQAEKALEKAMRPIYQLQEQKDGFLISDEDYIATYERLAKDSAKAAYNLEQLKKASNNLDIRFSKYASCDLLTQIYRKKLDISKDERILKQIIKFFPKAGCPEDNEVYIIAVEELHKMSPNAKTAYFMGKNKFLKKQYNEALEYFKQAQSLYDKESDSIITYLLMGACYQQMGQYNNARDCAYKILKLNPNEAQAYILMGDLYSQSSGVCSGLDLPASIYWAAADKYAKAKSIATDPAIAEQAQKKLNAAVARFPKTEEYFQRGLTKGQTYQVGCWIGETTTIR
ncbi:MAG: tetratricopeptide repeat protein [Bacteroidales bacterium]|jgi:tetratricopeptide (TPR) repeat protein|nr:tetratricopeptide repeat protein [Bacteroidales bacterium]